jgi:hypothetical protein
MNGSLTNISKSSTNLTELSTIGIGIGKIPTLPTVNVDSMTNQDI